MKWILFLVLTAICGAAHATNYYLSENGNDNNKGTSKSHPWRTLKKMNSSSLNFMPGDSIFFERGSLFNGHLEISGSGIYLGAFGSGAKPILSGSVELSPWTLVKNNIWKADCFACVSDYVNLFIDGKFQTLGRFPNHGYLSISNYLPMKNLISDENSNFSDGHWSGAEVVIKSSRWTIDRLHINEYRSKTFLLEEKPSYELLSGAGYFLQNHFSTLDQHGEWFFDFEKKCMFLFLKSGFNPNQHRIEASKIEVGLIATNASDLVVENIVLDKYYFGVHAENCDNLILNKIEISHSGKNGLDITACKNISADNCKITDSNNNGIESRESLGGKFTYNTIARTGLHIGSGASGNGTHIAFYLTSSNQSLKNTLIEYNTIDSTGYSGIDFRTARTKIKNNLVSNFCLSKDDGAGIYTWKNAGGENLIEGNTIRDGIGSSDGAIHKDELYVSGIYIDDHSSKIIVKNNVVSNCALAGIFIHNAHHLGIIGNTLYANANNLGNNEKGQLYIKRDNIGESDGNINLNLEVSQNKLMATSETSLCLFLSADKDEDLNQIGSFSQNQFSAVHQNQAVAKSFNQSGLCLACEQFTLTQWQLNPLNENGSTFKLLPSNGNFDVAGNDLIKGTKLNSYLEGWASWPEESSIEKENKNDGAIKIIVPTQIKEVLLYHRGIYLKDEKIYRLTFLAKSTKPNKIEFVPLMANSPWAALGKYTCFSTDSMYKTFTYYFKGDKNNVEARINFKSNSTFWIKDIALFEVTENQITTKN